MCTGKWHKRASVRTHLVTYSVECASVACRSLVNSSSRRSMKTTRLPLTCRGSSVDCRQRGNPITQITYYFVRGLQAFEWEFIL